jgi:hypothetical protein
MIEFNRIIIHGLHKIKVVRDTLPGGTVPSRNLTQLSAFVDHILLQKPDGLTLTNQYSITVINSEGVEYVDKFNNERFSIEMSNVNQTLLNSLLIELIGLINI